MKKLNLFTLLFVCSIALIIIIAGCSPLTDPIQTFPTDDPTETTTPEPIETPTTDQTETPTPDPTAIPTPDPYSIDTDGDGDSDGNEKYLFRTNPYYAEVWDGGKIHIKIDFDNPGNRLLPRKIQINSDNTAYLPRKLYAHIIKNIAQHNEYYIIHIERLDNIRVAVIGAVENPDIVGLAHQLLCEGVLKNALTGIEYDFYPIYYNSQVITEIKNLGIDVISYSLGGSCSATTINNLVTDYGVTICAGIGNDNQEGRFVGWSSPEYTIAVGGQDPLNPNIRWPDSNYGRISVKGVSIIASVAPFPYGTSFSTPRVAGAAAKMLITNPNVTPFNIRSILHKTATKIGNYTYNDIPHSGWEPGWNNEVGYGALNENAALQMVIHYQ